MQSPTTLSTASVAPVGTEEARARDAVFGTHTAPAAEPVPTPTPTVSAPEPAAPAPTAAPVEEPTRSEPKLGATKSAKSKKVAKKAKAKAKKAAVHVAAKPKPAKKAKREEPDHSGLGGVAKHSNDPLDGI
jgi:hypothetical protein